MSRQGIIIAEQYATELPFFDSIVEAEQSLYARRNQALREIKSITELNEKLDYSPESLKILEQWFFENDQPATTITGYSTSSAIAFYLGEVWCRHANFTWVVKEFPFAKGSYEIGVQRPLVSIMLTKGERPQIKNNKRMQSLWRKFEQYAS